MFIRIDCRNTGHLKNLLHDQIQPIEGIVRTETIISLEESLNRTVNVKELVAIK
jgi:Lrp/AsnC family transcriptional regulator for asnA, asnC and gidA